MEKKIKDLVGLINRLDLEGVSARYTGTPRNPDFILEIEGRFEERFETLDEMSECLNFRNKQENDGLLDDVDQAICEAARAAGLL
jgi:hypothetical protein